MVVLLLWLSIAMVCYYDVKAIVVQFKAENLDKLGLGLALLNALAQMWLLFCLYAMLMC